MLRSGSVGAPEEARIREAQAVSRRMARATVDCGRG